LAAAASAQLLGAACVIVGDMNPDRLEQARSFGCETIDLRQDASVADMLADILGIPEVDAGIDCVGFEAHAHGCSHHKEQPAIVLNTMMEVTRAAGGIGIPGLYVTGDPGAATDAAKTGQLSMNFGLGWAKSHSFVTGQCPVMKYHRQLMQAILWDKIDIAKAVNVQVISLDAAPEGYHAFDQGAAKKFVIDPHGMVN
jgi:glutathione-independent formaldehyde dehydrogenase